MTNANPVLAYLEAEFLRERQSCVAVTASFDADNDEVIYLDATMPIAENSQRVVRYSFECGSDDDAYCFVSDRDVVILPIQPFEV